MGSGGGVPRWLDTLAWYSSLVERLVPVGCHWEYCPPLAFGQYVNQNAACTAISGRIRAFDCTLVGKHVCSGEGVLGLNPTNPKIVPKFSAARWQLLRHAPWMGHHSRYITLFFEGTYSVIGFYELMGVFLAG